MNATPILPVYDHNIPSIQAFVFATVSPMCAVLFTNPVDTAKVRLQLQNKVKVQLYRNTFDCIYKILKNEGIRGIQQGLTPAIFREGSKNIFRIGLFDPLLNAMHDKKTDGPFIPLWKRIVASAATGAMGAIACNPFELIKTRLQAQTRTGTAIGYQHNYSGMLGAFSDIIKKDGASGLYKGSVLSVVRGIFGTSSNLSTYSFLRDYFLTNKILPDSALTDMICSTTSSLVTVIIMNPVDVVRTRVYNQPSLPSSSSSSLPSKDYYSGGMDALVKIVRNEGMGALYKGFTTNFIRLAPHFTLTFLFLEQFRRMSLNHTNKNFETEHKNKLNELYEVYNNKRFDDNSLVEVLHSGMPNQDKRHIENVVKEMNFSRELEFSDFAEIKEQFIALCCLPTKNMATTGKSVPPFIAFSKEKRAEVKEANPSLSFTELQKVLSTMWHGLSEDEKKQYRDQPVNSDKEEKQDNTTIKNNPNNTTTRIPFPKIALSPFSLFMSKKKEEIQKLHPLASRYEITSMLQDLWNKELPKEQKEEYEKVSTMDSQRYKVEWDAFNNKYPDIFMDEEECDDEDEEEEEEMEQDEEEEEEEEEGEEDEEDEDVDEKDMQ